MAGWSGRSFCLVGVVWTALVGLATGVLHQEAFAGQAREGAPLFGLVSLRFDRMPAAAPFREMEARLIAGPALSQCRRSSEGRCGSPLWQSWLDMRAGWTDAKKTPSGLDLVQQVNRFVNTGLRYADDWITWEREDYWATPAESLEKGQGDCEDFAILKMGLLAEMGWPARAMRIVVVRDLVSRRPHAILSLEVGQETVVLDNLSDLAQPDRLVVRYRPLYALTREGAWIYGYRAGRYF